VLSVGLNRPAKRNALNDGIMLAIQDCFSISGWKSALLVIHGIGDHFSSGLDLSELAEHDATEGLAAFADVASGVRPGSILPRAGDRRTPRRGDRRRARTRLRGAYSASPNPRPISRCLRASAVFLSAAADRSGCRG